MTVAVAVAMAVAVAVPVVAVLLLRPVSAGGPGARRTDCRGSPGRSPVAGRGAVEAEGLPDARAAFDTRNVDTVLVAGQVRTWAGRPTDVDLPALRAAAAASRDRILREAAAG
ncbi:hypothetical protein GCM10025734_82730 [Kitasatospora paranensis]